MADRKTQLAELGKDLLNRQVNLIIASGGMSAEPPPEDPVDVLRDVYRWYYDRLLGAGEEQTIATMTAGDLAVRFRDLAASLGTSSRAAERALAGVGDGPAGVTDRLLVRMEKTSRQLAENATVIDRGGELTAAQLAALRKAWEIGTDEIVLQTTIGLDGDVVLRADSRYCTDAHKALFDLHDQSCAAAMRTWRDVVGAAVELMNGLFAKISRR